MKKLLIILVILGALAILWGQQAEAPTGGTGSPDDPYQINSLANLTWILQNSDSWNAHYVQNADIMAFETMFWPVPWSGIGSLEIPFGGSYNGLGHSIQMLVVNSNSGHCALFGNTGPTALIQNLNLQDFMITGFSFVGSLVGQNAGIVSNCHANAQVSSGYIGSGDYFGGLVGYNLGLVTQSSSIGAVSNPQGNRVGGLVGENQGSISNCFSRSEVAGNNYVGGLIGANYLETSYSYSTGLINAFAPGAYVGGFIGYHLGSANANFWDVQTSGQSFSAGAIGLPTLIMQSITPYQNAGWNFTGIWHWDGAINQGYPFLVWPGAPPELTPPVADITIEANTVTLSWEPVNYAAGYIVYSSNNPYDGFAVDESGIYSANSWTAPVSASARYFKVIAYN